MSRWYAVRYPNGRNQGSYSLTGRRCLVRTFPDRQARDAYVEAQQPSYSVLFDGQRVAVPASTILTENGRSVPIDQAVPGF